MRNSAEKRTKPLKSRRNLGYPIDDKDRRLLSALDRNARVSTADLARLVELSPQSTAERVRRLEDVGVVAGFGIRLAPAALGLTLGAYIRIQPAMGELRRVAELLPTIPEIVECDRVTGEDCFVAKVYVTDVGALERIIDRLLPFARTNTSIIQSSPVARRLPPISPRA